MEYLVFQHVPQEPPGLIADVTREQGIGLEVVELWKPGYKIPPMRDFRALIIMGGPMGVYEGPEVFPSKEEELSVIRDNIDKKPIIGFCLGAQLLAHALGGKVYPNFKDGKRAKEIGYYTVDLTDEGKRDPLLAGFSSPMEVTQWHGDAFDVPNGAVLLASSPLCDNQAIRIGKNAYGFLFHFELKPPMIAELIKVDKKWIHEDFEMDEAKLLKQAEDKKALMQRQCEMLFKNFKKLAHSSKWKTHGS